MWTARARPAQRSRSWRPGRSRPARHVWSSRFLPLGLALKFPSWQSTRPWVPHDRQPAEPRTPPRRRSTTSRARAGVSVGRGVVRDERPPRAWATGTRAPDPRRGGRARLEPERAGACARPRRGAGAIGLLLARPVETLEVDPFFLRFLAGVERALARTDHALLLRVLDARGAGRRSAALRAARRRRAASTASCSATSSSTTRASTLLADAGLPVVVAGRPAGAVPVPVRSRPRHAEGLAAATAHLVELGHARIGFLGGPRALRARAGAARGLAGATLAARRASSRARSRSATRSALLGAREPTGAAICTSDVLAAGGARGGARARARRARRPRDDRLRRLAARPRSPRRR